MTLTIASPLELGASYVSPHADGALIRPSAIGGRLQSYCHTPALMATAVGSLISDRLGLDPDSAGSKLCDHLQVSFLAVPILACCDQ